MGTKRPKLKDDLDEVWFRNNARNLLPRITRIEIKKDKKVESNFRNQKNPEVIKYWLNPLNARFKLQSLPNKATIQEHRGKLVIRGTFKNKFGESKRIRISTGLDCHVKNQEKVEKMFNQLMYSLDESNGVLPEKMPWEKISESKAISNAVTFRDAMNLLHEEFWRNRDLENSQSKKTWFSYLPSLKRLENAGVKDASLSVNTLVSIAEKSTKPNSRARLETVKLFKRMVNQYADPSLFGDIKELDKIRGKYQPKVKNFDDINDQFLMDICQQIRNNESWGWATCAVFIYGCRPSEVFNLRPNKSDNGATATVMTLNKAKSIVLRTTMALPKESVQILDLQNIQRPYECSIRNYDAYEVKRQTDMWRKWLQNNVEQNLDLYTFRHSWCIRAARKNVATSIAAKCAGHSVPVYEKTYLQGLDKRNIQQYTQEFL